MGAAVELHRVGKRYLKLDERSALLRSVLPFGGPARDDLWALRGIDLNVEDGEIVGVLGANGAGKTTLLRLLAGVTRPTEGRVLVRGRIAPLISLGVGFHPEMSGRENAVLNGRLLGLSSKQSTERLDDIVEFAELEDFIDTPVKFYSAGMSMRLGFSVIMHTDPTVLLIDEILAVGDAAFHVKSFDRLRTLHAEGATIIMVSHSMHMLRQLCRRGIVMRAGQIHHDGDIEDAIALHCATMSKLDGPADHATVVDVVERRLVVDEDENHHVGYDTPIELQLRLRFYRETPACRLSFAIVGAMGQPVASHSQVLQRERPFREGEEVEAKVRFRARLGGGNYELVARIHSTEGELLGISEGLILFVAGRPGSLGALDLRATIQVDGEDRTDRRTSLLDHSQSSI
jgi:ABC-type polysaccharide/polyol phosphate transport system ATPase subunit